jgi:hypothetical protein
LRPDDFVASRAGALPANHEELLEQVLISNPVPIHPGDPPVRKG